MATTYGERLKEAIRKSGKTQAQLASHLHVTNGVVSQWASGLRRPKVERSNEIAAFLCVDPAWLIGANEEATSVAADALEQELLSVFRALTIRQKTMLLAEAYKMSDGNKE